MSYINSYRATTVVIRTPLYCRFWEEDEEFYKAFDGAAINNPFQLIDDMMEQYGDQSDQSALLASSQPHRNQVTLDLLL